MINCYSSLYTNLSYRIIFLIGGSKEDFEEKVTWLEDRFIDMLDKNIKIVRITAYLKRWWNKDVKEARRTLGRASKAWGRRGGDLEEFK